MTEYLHVPVPGSEEDMNHPETGSVDSFVLGIGGAGGGAYQHGGGAYQQEDDDSIYSHREHGHGTDGGPHSGKYRGLNLSAKHRNNYHDGNGANSHFISNDKGHMRIYQQVRGRSVPIEFYMTKYSPGTLIRNAISGIREHKLYVGKKEEYNFFKVKLALPDMGQDQYGTLFYNSPEEYERHFYTTVPQPLKEQWMERIMSAHRTNLSSMSSASNPSRGFREHDVPDSPTNMTAITGWFQNRAPAAIMD